MDILLKLFHVYFKAANKFIPRKSDSKDTLPHKFRPMRSPDTKSSGTKKRN